MSHDFEPHYRRIIADIRARIAAGDLAPASKLPSTRELAHRYGVSPGSVRQAVTILIETGDLRGHQGLGVFVADLPEGPSERHGPGRLVYPGFAGRPDRGRMVTQSVPQEVQQMALSLPIDPAATALLRSDPLALLLGMLLDQQIPMEKAFSSPYVLKQRLGHDLNAAEIANFDPDAFETIFATPPALHRFPRANAKRAQELCQVIVAKYDGDASRLWSDAATGAELVARVGQLPGFGRQKSQIFVALLAKQFDVTPPGWREATGPYGEAGSYRSVADITDEGSLAKVREYKQAAKAAAKA